MGLTRKKLDSHAWGFKKAKKPRRKEKNKEKTKKKEKVTFLNTPISLKLSRQKMESLEEERWLKKELGEIWD